MSSYSVSAVARKQEVAVSTGLCINGQNIRLKTEPLCLAHSENVPRGDYHQGDALLSSHCLGYTLGIIHRLLLWMISIERDLACTVSQRASPTNALIGAAPQLKGKCSRTAAVKPSVSSQARQASRPDLPQSAIRRGVPLNRRTTSFF